MCRLPTLQQGPPHLAKLQLGSHSRMRRRRKEILNGIRLATAAVSEVAQATGMSQADGRGDPAVQQRRCGSSPTPRGRAARKRLSASRGRRAPPSPQPASTTSPLSARYRWLKVVGRFFAISHLQPCAAVQCKRCMNQCKTVRGVDLPNHCRIITGIVLHSWDSRLPLQRARSAAY